MFAFVYCQENQWSSNRTTR